MTEKMTIGELLKTVPEADQKVWREAIWEFRMSGYYSGSWMGYRNGVADAQNNFINVPPHIIGALEVRTWGRLMNSNTEQEKKEQEKKR